jgi:hypothetical protein
MALTSAHPVQWDRRGVGNCLVLQQIKTPFTDALAGGARFEMARHCDSHQRVVTIVIDKPVLHR